MLCELVCVIRRKFESQICFLFFFFRVALVYCSYSSHVSILLSYVSRIPFFTQTPTHQEKTLPFSMSNSIDLLIVSFTEL
ncbi:hypothetical protein HanRHA438_Chr13g0580001 [Helianthus annuus]|nr:hypothetical protein HanRHA438_Chr13g0580001 [Helianthus annuus]